MATGASTADLAIILIDARHGVQVQTKRHSFIVSLLGIRHIVVTVNKMDLIGFDQAKFESICNDYRNFAARLDLPDLHFIPISALNGDNVVDKSPSMPWYQGSTLMNFLETVYIGSDRNMEDFRLPVQFVLRPNLDFRGFSGTIASGIVRKGDEVMVLPSRQKSRIKRIVTQDGDLDEAFTPQSVTLVLDSEVDCSRGDMLVRPGNIPQTDNQFDATIVWMSAEPMLPGKSYLFKHTTQSTLGQIDSLKYRVDVNTLHRTPAPELALNEIGRCGISVNQPLFFDSYRRNRTTGSFIIIDRVSNITVGAGMISDRGVNRDRKLAAWEASESEAALAKAGEVNVVTNDERAARFGQKPATVLITGLTGTGKLKVALALERKLFDAGRASIVIDGERMRQGMNRDLGYSVEDRSENLRRSAFTARLINDNGLFCIASFVAPSQAIRERVAETIGQARFFTVYLTADESIRRERDAYGQYASADAGKLPNFPGVTANYEAPENADLSLDTGKLSIEECVDKIYQALVQRGFLKK